MSIHAALRKASRRYPFGADDFFQQLLGAMLLSAPFVFTEEVWTVASSVSPVQSGMTLLFTALLGHGVLYVASQQRDFGQERKLLGVTYRYISLLAVSFGSVGILLALTSVHTAFGATALTTAKALAIFSVFSVIGAATADNLI